ANGVDQNRAQSFLYFSADLPKMNKPRQEVAYWVALAAMHSWKDMVNGREEWWPGKVIQFLADWPGFVLYAANWERDWAAIWEIFMQELNRLDAQALVPVAQVVAAQRDAA
ncbi:TPA: hypothetical protein L4W60_006195, partial [Pseudomonas aeruginosa]|nr:hypothetical protein [Pseudomonas aeruginosa]HDQ4101173.1 hypothetical protein [Pseudomonas aeruginosa]